MNLIFGPVLLATAAVGVVACDAVLLHKKNAIWWAGAALALIIILSGLMQ